MSDFTIEQFRRISQRFSELEAEIRELRDTVQTLENSVGSFNAVVAAQTDMIQKVWIMKNGTGEV